MSQAIQHHRQPETEEAEDRAESAVELLCDRYGAEYAEWWVLYCLSVVRQRKQEEVRQ